MHRHRSGTSTASSGPLLDAKEDASLRLMKQVVDPGFSRVEVRFLRILRVAGRLYWGLRVAARFASSRPPWRVRRILVVRQSWLGDLVVFLPTLAALRARFPGARLTLGVQSGFGTGGILEASGLVDEVREITFPEGGRSRMAGAVRLFTDGYDLVVHGAWYYMLRAAFFSGAPRTIGIDDGHPRQTELDFTVALQPMLHEAENNLAVAEALGARPEPAARVPRLSLVDDPPRLAALRARLELTADAPLMAMHPGSKRLSRRWPSVRFADLATRLLEERATLQIVLTGTQDEHALAESIKALVPKPLQPRLVNAAGACNLVELRLLLGACEVLVCNDTGVMHVARAQATPLVALLGPENDLRWGPHPLGPAPAISLRHHVPCAPCNRDLCEPHWCLRLLSVADVRSAVHELASAATASRAGGEAFRALERRQQQHDWRDLAAAGYEVPLVTVVLVEQPDPRVATAGLDAAASIGAITDDEGSNLALSLRALTAQRYPRLEVVVVSSGVGRALPKPATDTAREPGFDRVVALQTSPEGRLAWPAILDATQGEFMCLTSTSQVRQWRIDKLHDDVSALVRTPDAAYTTGVSPPAADPAPISTEQSQPWAFRRTALLAALAANVRALVVADALVEADGAKAKRDGMGASLEDAMRALLAPLRTTVSAGFVTQPLPEHPPDEPGLQSQERSSMPSTGCRHGPIRSATVSPRSRAQPR